MPAFIERIIRPDMKSDSTLSRRHVLKRGGAIAGAAGLLGATQAAGLAQSNEFGFDVACNGGTMVFNRKLGNPPDSLVLRGDTFLVQGRIYPAGTIAQGLTGPGQAGGIGTWVCHGWLFHDAADILNGAVPHTITTQHYLLDSGDGLVSEGTEGGQYTLRVITGGYGLYHGARGSVSEAEVETNNTLINLGEGVLAPAPNITFQFQLT